MPLQQNRTSDLTPELVYSKWVGFDWESDHNAKERFFQDLEALRHAYFTRGYDAAKAQIQKLVEQL